MKSLLPERLPSICPAKGPSTESELRRTMPPNWMTSTERRVESSEATLNADVMTVRRSFWPISRAMASVVVPDATMIVSSGPISRAA